MSKFKALLIRLFLTKEVDALKQRLAEATTALTRIEASVVALPKEASAEAHALAEKVLKVVVGSADSARRRLGDFSHSWEEAIYLAHEAENKALGSFDSTLALSERLIDRTELFFRK